jgi:hypothetical protein
VIQTLKARQCILTDLGYTHSLARKNLVDGSIDLALFLKRVCVGKETKGYLMSLNSEEYIDRLIERLHDSTTEIEDLRNKLLSLKFLILRLFAIIKLRVSNILMKHI